jgi:hypothetical protein
METLIDGQIACVWAITFNDPEIWKNEIRMPQYTFIALQQTLTLEAIIGILVEWAKEYARSIEKDFVRLDTLGNNIKLIEHYTNAGLDFLGYSIYNPQRDCLHTIKRPKVVVCLKSNKHKFVSSWFRVFCFNLLASFYNETKRISTATLTQNKNNDST